MRINYSKKVLGFSFIVAVIVIILVAIFCSLLIEKIVGINDKVKQIEVSSQERERSATLRVSVANTQEGRENLNKYFISVNGVINLIEQLENLAKETGVTLDIKFVGYEAIKQVTADTLEQVKFKVAVSGSWSKVIKFFKLVETFPAVVYLDSTFLNLIASKTKEQTWLLDLEFSVIKIKD